MLDTVTTNPIQADPLETFQVTGPSLHEFNAVKAEESDPKPDCEDCLQLESASLDQRDDPETILIASSQNSVCFTYASTRLRSSKPFILVAISQNPHIFQYVDPVLKADKAFVCKAARTDGLALIYAIDELQTDLELWLVAVSSNGRALEFAPESIKSNRKVVKAAVQNYYGALKYAPQFLIDVGITGAAQAAVVEGLQAKEPVSVGKPQSYCIIA